jgi:hypothetical protein
MLFLRYHFVMSDTVLAYVDVHEQVRLHVHVHVHVSVQVHDTVARF